MNPSSRAEILETLFPSLMRTLYKPYEGDPLSELTIGQLRIVRLLYSQNHTVSTLGDELGMSMSATTQMTHRLEAAGLIEKLDDPLDRRVKILSLSHLGHSLMEQRRQRRIERVQFVLDAMDESRQGDLLNVLEEMRQACMRLDLSNNGERHAAFGDLEHAMPLASPRQGE